jgi:hypothetical protein
MLFSPAIGSGGGLNLLLATAGKSSDSFITLDLMRRVLFGN